MIRLLAIPARLKLWAIAAITAIAGVLAVYAKGRADANARAKLRNLQGNIDTTEKVLHETVSDDPADDLRKRMRDRARKP